MAREIDAMDFVEDLAGTFGGRSTDGDFVRLQMSAELDRQRLLAVGVEKAITTGSGNVVPGDTGGRALRNEFLHGALSTETVEERHAATFNSLKKVPVKNTAIQWVRQTSNGNNGDGFLPETGLDGAFGGDVESDADFEREIENVSFIHDIRQIGMVADMVDNLVNPTSNAQKSALAVIKQRANLNALWGDRTTNSLASNGLRAQIMHGVQFDPSQRMILFDAGGYTLDKEFELEICRVMGLQAGNPTRQIMGITAHADLMASLFPEQRTGDPVKGGSFGVDRDAFVNPYGTSDLKFFTDFMIRPNEPLVPLGVGNDGLPRTSATANKNNSCAWGAQNPWSGNGGVSAVNAGTDYFFNNVTTNAMGAPIATTPAVPASTDGNASNQLGAHPTRYYAIAPVYLGREAQPWVYGAAAAGTITSAVGTALPAGKIGKIAIDLTTVNGGQTSIVGLGNTINRSWLRFRIYACDTAPTSVASFQYLCEVGCPSAGDTLAFDNGMYIPGTESSIVLTESDEDGPSVFYAQLLPVLKRELPHKLLSDIFGYLLFGTPIVKKRMRHVLIRNIGRTKR